MTIEKRGSKYRITQMDDGVRYRVMVDHKPSNAEAMRLIAAEMDKPKYKHDKQAFKSACEAYIDAKRNVLSPASVRTYMRMLKAFPEELAKKNIYDITKKDIQVFINEYSVNHAPKTVKSISGFISSVLIFNDIHLSPPTLPKIMPKEPYIPSEDEVKRLLAHITDSRYECAVLLAVRGLRVAEICAVTKDDLKGNILSINKTKVYDENGKWVLRNYTKTAKSTRKIKVADRIVELLKKNHYAYSGYPAEFTKYLDRTLKELGIQKFSPHKLRHFCVSFLHQMGYTDAQIEDELGFETDAVMKSVYLHAMEKEQTQNRIAETFGNIM